MTIDFNKPIEIKTLDTATVKFIKRVNNDFYPNLCMIKNTLEGKETELYMQYTDDGNPVVGHYVLVNSVPVVKKVIKTGYIHLYRSSMGVVYSVGPFTNNEYPERNGKFLASVPISWEEDHAANS